MTETAIRAKNLVAALNGGRVGRRPDWISSSGNSRWSCRGLGIPLVGASFLGREGDRRLLCYQGSRAKPQ
jgi:hypothetical protein